MDFIRKNSIAVIIVVLVLVGGGLFVANQNKAKDSQSTTTSTQEKSTTVKVTVKADGQEKSYGVENAVGKTALQVTEEAVTIEKSGEGANAFITSISGRAADDSKKEFWKLVVNGEDAQVGAGSYTLTSGDNIVWEIDTY